MIKLLSLATFSSFILCASSVPFHGQCTSLLAILQRSRVTDDLFVTGGGTGHAGGYLSLDLRHIMFIQCNRRCKLRRRVDLPRSKRLELGVSERVCLFWMVLTSSTSCLPASGSASTTAMTGPATTAGTTGSLISRDTIPAGAITSTPKNFLQYVPSSGDTRSNYSQQERGC